MFVSQERNSNKKRFKKPNILRRKPKPAVRSSGKSETKDGSDILGTQNSGHEINKTSLQQTIIDDVQIEDITRFNYPKPFQTVQNESVSSLNFENTLLFESIEGNQDVNVIKQYSNESSFLINIVNYAEESPVQSSLNVESFFNDEENTEVKKYTKINNYNKKNIDEESHRSSLYNDQNEDLITSMVPMSAVTTSGNKTQGVLEQALTVVPPKQLLEHLSSGSTKFKCDVPDCCKEFRSEKKWKRHKNVHNEDGSIRLPRQVTSECPVKKVNADGTEQRCGKIYLMRDQLVKHLKEDHTIEDAAYRCDECGRQFFWASGLRAHSRSHSPRRARAVASLACGWPGCSRVFSQPCRLREHARTHTGDKPYHCTFPNCGFSFRSASKLSRHARRHLGLRRHACGVCGVAFLRAEHLRDHTNRHIRQRNKNKELRLLGFKCDEVLEGADAIQAQITTSQEKEERAAVPETVTTDFNEKDNLDYVFLAVENDVSEKAVPQMDEETVEIVSASDVGIAEEFVECEESRAARTHCPWPLEPCTQQHDAVAEEQAEGSESNIYTVRSDLFLHGNVLINEDSVELSARTEPADELGLSLLESPHIDLMQEEMMFNAWQ